MNSGLNQSIIKTLSRRLERSEAVVRARISQIRSGRPSLTLNAAAFLYAKKNSINVAGKLNDTDRNSLQGVQQNSEKITVIKEKSRKKVKDFVVVDIENKFAQNHIKEINKAYNSGCYTAVFILTRKVIENFIIDILIKRFPEKKKANRELYYNINQNRFHDFSVILKNLFSKRRKFPVACIKPIERLNQLAKVFIKNANDQTHSWYYTASKKEIHDAGIQDIFDLIRVIQDSL